MIGCIRHLLDDAERRQRVCIRDVVDDLAQGHALGIARGVFLRPLQRCRRVAVRPVAQHGVHRLVALVDIRNVFQLGRRVHRVVAGHMLDRIGEGIGAICGIGESAGPRDGALRVSIRPVTRHAGDRTFAHQPAWDFIESSYGGLRVLISEFRKNEIDRIGRSILRSGW